MMFKTHLALGFLIGLVSIRFLGTQNKIIFFLIVLFASLLPDIDSTKSFLGKKIKVIGWIFDHRGFFHSIFAAALAGLLCFSLTLNINYASAVIIGYTAHLIGDAMTKEGIMPLQPLLKSRITGFFSTGGIIELSLFFMFILFDVYGIFVIFL